MTDCCFGKKQILRKNGMIVMKKKMSGYCSVMMIARKSGKRIVTTHCRKRQMMNVRMRTKTVTMPKNYYFPRMTIPHCWDRLQAHLKPVAPCREYRPHRRGSGW